MALKSGLASQIGFVKETTAGTAVTVTQFAPLVSESLMQDKARLESAGIIAGRRVLTSDQWNGGNITVSGDVQFELYNRGLGQLFEACIGTRDTTGAEDPYTHTFTPGDLSALTVQIGRPATSGTVHAFTYAGCHVASWQIACSAGEIATIGASLVGMSETTATALATASYPTGLKPLKFNHGTVSVGGSELSVRSATLSGDNGLAVDRRFIGSQTISAPLEAGHRSYTGSLEIEFASLTEYTRYVDGTEFAVVLDFVSGTDEVKITLNARYDGSTPNVGGPGILTQSMPFKAIASGADTTAITAVLKNADAMA